MSKRYYTLNEELRREFGGKVMKLSLDGGFTCPNRDGTIGSKGCIFCGEKGSGEFAGSRLVSIEEQIEEQKKLLSKKWDSNKYIAYFQNFTNTYGPIDRIRTLYYEAINTQGVVGLAVATRPDCLEEETLKLLSEINKKTYLWIELGLQTIHEKSAKLIRRGYPLSIYEEAIEKLKRENIKVVTHIILGIPGESKDDMLNTVKFVAGTKTWGIKLHSLYIQMDTDLYDYYMKNPFPIMSREEYVSLVVDAIEMLPRDMVIHRITGDGKRELLHEPKWSLDKLKVLSMIDKELKIRNFLET
ncbi:TIGR01212 family radical SAM protein [Tissierella carlieri]|uniref:TIGR01212 family radical SAM protein n=1 Tax=Tissierella carlieri TaxID=689904 RepID=A0ABT1SFZ6_9FIRM|nr:TIGR01212 family radical SAM protein [Tissierella carlieri]MCQ4925419.1 TIGR01212 family radical SAM protein [Tissierella carlieri]